MSFCTQFTVAAVGLLFMARFGIAAPNPSPLAFERLFKRDRVIFDDCGDRDDPKRIKAGRAYAEAATLASFTKLGTTDDGTKYQSTDA